MATICNKYRASTRRPLESMQHLSIDPYLRLTAMRSQLPSSLHQSVVQEEERMSNLSIVEDKGDQGALQEMSRVSFGGGEEGFVGEEEGDS